MPAYVSVDSLIGRKFGRLRVLSRAGSDKHLNPKLSCICDCGNEVTVLACNLRKGTNTRSCGCLAKELGGKQSITHGKSLTSEYRIWRAMKNRCYRPKDTQYSYYGGRGIKVCPRWLLSFQNFFKDMGLRPSNRHSIDRKNNNDDYTPENCRWATYKENASNTSSKKMWVVECKKYLNIMDAADKHDTSRSTIMRWCNGRVEKGRLVSKRKPNCYSYLIYGGNNDKNI